MKKTLRAIGGIFIFIIVWHLFAAIMNMAIVPAPAETLCIMAKYLFTGTVFEAAWQTAWKVLVALTLVLLSGIPAGLLLGLSEKFYDMFRPIMLVIQAVPVISWLALVIIIWGIGWRGPIFIAFVALIPISVLTTVQGVRSLDINLLEMACIYRVSKCKILTEIYLGSLVPFIVAILDVTLGQAWKVILVAEYLCGGNGLGVEILTARMGFNFESVWAYTLIAVILGIITERLIKWALGRIIPQWKLALPQQNYTKNMAPWQSFRTGTSK